jgi:hypothetical protein
MRMLSRAIGGLVGKKGLAALLTAAALGLGAAPAQAASDPLFVFSPTPSQKPVGDFEGPCGLGVDLSGNFYVADYYHHAVDVFAPTRTYLTQLTKEDPLDGPCGLAIDATGHLYINNFHRNVVRFTASPFPVTLATKYAGQLTIDSGDPTGVAVDPTGNAYVNDRTYIAAYDSSGAPLLDGGNPLRIGLGTLENGYGLAFSAGRLYVPDAATETVKIYVPATSLTTPAATISGPPGGFSSLVDSAIAVDRVSGDIYVADAVSSPLTERPQTTIQVFDSTGAYKGHLKYDVISGGPPGLAVDNSAGANQGRVYVTSGNTNQASVYAYGPGSATSEPAVPAALAPGGGSSTGGRSSADGLAAGSSTQQGPMESRKEVTAHASEVTQKGSLRVSVDGELSPQRLPREGTAPIAVQVGWQIATTDESPPPKLKTLQIEINRHGQLDYDGLPTCPYAKIQPATTQRALSNCRSALVGKGDFEAQIALEGQETESYASKGRLLVFNGVKGKKPVLLGHIYSGYPFATSFVITFAVKQQKHGTYGTALTATLPKALRGWGNLTAIQMRLSRRYGYQGERHSYLSAGCPAPEGFSRAAFPLARTSFRFDGGASLSSTLTRTCGVRG